MQRGNFVMGVVPGAGGAAAFIDFDTGLARCTAAMPDGEITPELGELMRLYEPMATYVAGTSSPIPGKLVQGIDWYHFAGIDRSRPTGPQCCTLAAKLFPNTPGTNDPGRATALLLALYGLNRHLGVRESGAYASAPACDVDEDAQNHGDE